MSTDELPLRRIGRYVLASPLGSGGMGSVRLAIQVGGAGFERVVAIKRMHRELSQNPEAIAMFRDEVMLSCQVQHPNVVTALDVISDEHELLLVMDYIHGASLAQLVELAYLRGERLPPAVASSILVGLLHGLHAAHEASTPAGEKLGLIHRDVSPDNVLVGCDGYTRLADFGIAKAVGRLQRTQVGQLKGKLGYLAPERLSGSVVDRRCDIYSAAVVLWETLAGTSLFDADNEAEVLAKLVSRPLPSLSSLVPDISPSLQQLVEKGLSLEPNDRFATAREMALALQAEIAPISQWELAEWLSAFASESLQAKSLYLQHLRMAGYGQAEAALSSDSARRVAATAAVSSGPPRKRPPKEIAGSASSATPNAQAPLALLGAACLLAVASTLALNVGLSSPFNGRVAAPEKVDTGRDAQEAPLRSGRSAHASDDRSQERQQAADVVRPIEATKGVIAAGTGPRPTEPTSAVSESSSTEAQAGVRTGRAARPLPRQVSAPAPSARLARTPAKVPTSPPNRKVIIDDGF